MPSAYTCHSSFDTAGLKYVYKSWTRDEFMYDESGNRTGFMRYYDGSYRNGTVEEYNDTGVAVIRDGSGNFVRTENVLYTFKAIASNIYATIVEIGGMFWNVP